MICPLLIPWLIVVDDKMDTKSVVSEVDCDKVDATNKNYSVVVHVMKQIYHFYTAPMVKFCCHSVTTVNL